MRGCGKWSDIVEATSNSQRESINRMDWREAGHEVGDKIRVNNQYFSVDENKRYGWGSSGKGNVNIQATINNYANQLLDAFMEQADRETSIGRLSNINAPQSLLQHFSLIREARNNIVVQTPENFLEDSLRNLTSGCCFDNEGRQLIRLNKRKSGN